MWFIKRSTGGWGWMAWALILFHFAVPFLILLQQDLKKSRYVSRPLQYLSCSCGSSICSFLSGRVRESMLMEQKVRLLFPGWILSRCSLSADLVWYFLDQLIKRPLVPVMDPFLENAIEHGHGH